MSQVTVKFDLYSLYDRLLEGVIVDVILEYDIDNIINTNDLSNTTVTIKSITLTGDNLMYIDSQPFDKKSVYEDVAKHFDNKLNRLEIWGETITDEEFNLIEPIVLRQIKERNPGMTITTEIIN